MDDNREMLIQIKDIASMQADIRELIRANDSQDKQIKRHEERLKKYDTMATKAMGIGLGFIAAGVLLSSGVDVIRNKLLGVFIP